MSNAEVSADAAAVTLKPVGERVVLRKTETETKTPGGIIVPEMAQKEPVTGTVIACGPGKHTADGCLLPMNCQVGDKILFGRYDATDVSVDGEMFTIVDDSKILALVV